MAWRVHGDRVRVEHAYYRFIDMRSMWSQDAECGHIRNIRVEP